VILPEPVAYLLGEGDSLGAVQVGMLQTLIEHDVAPDLVVGTSVGSFNGAVAALEPGSTANRLANAWARMPGVLASLVEDLADTAR
jgi:Patatin-like phospholipase.